MKNEKPGFLNLDASEGIVKKPGFLSLYACDNLFERQGDLGGARNQVFDKNLVS